MGSYRRALLRSAVLSTVLLISLLASGCAVILPAHPKSMDKDSLVTAKFMTLEETTVFLAGKPGFELSKEELAELPERFAGLRTKLVIKPEDPRVPGKESAVGTMIAAEGAALLAGLAIDFVKGKLEEEAKLYEASYSGTWTTDEYWKFTDGTGKEVALRDVYNAEDVRGRFIQLIEGRPTKALGEQDSDLQKRVNNWQVAVDSFARDNSQVVYLEPRYASVLVCRSKPTECGTSTDAALEYLVLMIPSRDNTALRLKPRYFSQQRTKAKVLRSVTMFPWTWGWLGGAEQKVETKVDLQFTSAFRDKKGQFHSNLKIGEVTAGPYTTDLEAPAARGPIDLTGTAAWDSGYIGWLPIIPQSYIPAYNGLFGYGLLEVDVTMVERDTSRAKEYLTRGATELEGRRDGLIQQTRAMITGEEPAKQTGSHPVPPNGPSILPQGNVLPPGGQPNPGVNPVPQPGQ